MAQKGREAAAKRGRERARQERKQAKAEQKSAASDEPTEDIDEAGLMEEFRVLSEKHAAGQISDEILRVEKHRIFVALGIETEADA